MNRRSLGCLVSLLSVSLVTVALENVAKAHGTPPNASEPGFFWFFLTALKRQKLPETIEFCADPIATKVQIQLGRS